MLEDKDANMFIMSSTDKKALISKRNPIKPYGTSRAENCNVWVSEMKNKLDRIKGLNIAKEKIDEPEDIVINIILSTEKSELKK